MLYLILLLSQIDQVNYYYFTTENCYYCELQLPIIQRLQKEGFDFEIINDPKNFNITAFPTIIIELIDYKKQKVKQIRLVGFRSYRELKRILKQ